MDFALGFFIAMSHGLGFSNGVGAEALAYNKFFEVRGSYTSEQKTDDDYGYTWGFNALGTLPIGPCYAGVGYTSYGYSASGWEKSDDGATYALGFRPDRSDYRLYYIDGQEYSEVWGFLANMQMTDEWSVAIDVNWSKDYDAYGADVGIRYTF